MRRVHMSSSWIIWELYLVLNSVASLGLQNTTLSLLYLHGGSCWSYPVPVFPFHLYFRREKDDPHCSHVVPHGAFDLSHFSLVHFHLKIRCSLPKIITGIFIFTTSLSSSTQHHHHARGIRKLHLCLFCSSLKGYGRGFLHGSCWSSVDAMAVLVLWFFPRLDLCSELQHVP